VTVARTGSTSNPFAVDYSTGEGTATAGADYTSRSGTLSFASGESTKSIILSILNDSLIEGDESVIVTLSNPSGGVAIGNQSFATIVIGDDDTLPTQYQLTIAPSPAGFVAPPSGSYPTNSIQVLTATPTRGYEFVRWEGTFGSTNNPLFLLLTQDHVLTARFRAEKVLDGFETGDLLVLPWSGGGESAWMIENQNVGAGQYAVRSGLITDDQSSSLMLLIDTQAGAGSFDFRVSSEQGWDFLEFYLNGVLLQRWSGEVGWQNYQFSVSPGINQLEWRYAKDANFSAGLDGAFVDNLFLPQNTPDPTERPAVLQLYPLPSRASLIELKGQAARTYVLEVSGELRKWAPFATNTLAGNLMFIEDRQATNRSAGFYRAVAR